MPEIKKLETKTVIETLNSLISITAIFDQTGSDVLSAFISDTVKVLNTIPFIEGELGITMNDNYPDGIDFEFDQDGNLIITSDDADQYSIDENGNLIFTE